MIPAAFGYHRPQSAAEAAATLADLGDEAKVLAGGHNMLPLMKLRFAEPTGDPQIRNRGTIGGSVAHDDPAGEYGTVCLMLDA